MINVSDFSLDQSESSSTSVSSSQEQSIASCMSIPALVIERHTSHSDVNYVFIISGKEEEMEPSTDTGLSSTACQVCSFAL